MKRIITGILALSLALTCLPALAEGIPTLLQNDPDRKLVSAATTSPVNPEIPGEHPITGEAWTGLYMPMLSQIDNANGGISAPDDQRAPWGVSSADILYETPLHRQGDTRISALFSSTLPEEVGPIRSARIAHATLREEWGAGFVFHGRQQYDDTNVDDFFRKTGASQLGLLFDNTAGGKPWNHFYYRVTGLRNPHNVSAYIQKLQGLIPEGYTPPSRPYLFNDELPTRGDHASSLRINLDNSTYSSSFTYDAASNSYFRYVHDEPYVDKSNDVHMSFSNVIIQRTDVAFPRSDAPVVTLIGSGNADIFMGGRYIPGYWVRSAMDQRTVFFDENGNEIKLQRGKTFISIVDKSTPVYYYE